MAQEEIIKGRIAETIVRCLFEDLGFEVIPYGYENTCPTIAKRGDLIKGDVKNLIRKSPDFIVVDKDKNANFIEVKYRSDGSYRKETDYPFRDCYIIVLTKEYIGIEQYKNLDDETTLTSANFCSKISGSFKSLKDIDIFNKCDGKIVAEYRRILMKYMK
jgi:hypothetical protein